MRAEKLVELRDVVPRKVEGARIGAGATLAELEVDPTIPQALREACALAASPQLRSMSTLGGNLLQATRCWYWRLKFPCYLNGGDVCHAKAGQHREHLRDQRRKVLNLTGGRAHNHNSDLQSGHVLLVNEVLIHRDEYFKMRIRCAKKFAIAQSQPIPLPDSLHVMPSEQHRQTLGKAFV